MSFYVKAIGLLTGAVTLIYVARKFRRIHDINSSNDKSNIGFYVKYVRIPRKAVGLVIGKHGKTSRLLEFETKTYTQLCYYNEIEISRVKNSEPLSAFEMGQEDDDWDDKKKVEPKNKADSYAFIRIQGKTWKSIDLAVKKIRGIVFDWQRNNYTERVRIPSEATGYVIGKNGRNIKSISHSCRVRVTTYIIDNDYEGIELFGTEEGVKSAIKRINTSISRYVQSLEEKPEIMEFAPEPVKSSGLFDNVAMELAEFEKLRSDLENAHDW